MIMLAMTLAAAMQATPSPAPTDAAAPAAKPPKMECRYEDETGSTLAKKVCHTPEEWRQAEDQVNTGSRLSAGATVQRSGGPR